MICSSNDMASRHSALPLRYFSAYLEPSFDRKKIRMSTHPYDESKVIDVKTIHISCKSDTFRGNNYNYAGVIIYKHNGKVEWKTPNGTRCKSGYVVIQDTDKQEVKQWRGKTDGVVHGAVYRNVFGEDVDTTNVIGEGFSIQSGLFKVNSGVFNNPEESEYHDSRKQMSNVSLHCIDKVVESWKNAGLENWLGCRNFSVRDLLEDY